jgi:hypothetical protein
MDLRVPEGEARQIDVPFDARLFLEVPEQLRGQASPDRASWLREVCAGNTVADEWQDDPDGLLARLDTQIGLLSPDAFAGFLFCPRGLPGDVLVEVHVGEVEVDELSELDSSPAPVALPPRVRPISSPTLGEGRVTSSVAATESGGAIGELRFEFLRDRVLVEVFAASAELGILGATLPILEEFAAGISVRRADEGSIA